MSLIEGETEEENSGASVYVGAFYDTSSGSLRCLLPANLDLHRLCASRVEGSLWPAKHRHKLAYIVHAIICGFHRQRAENVQDTARGVPLNAILLRSLLGKGKRDFAHAALDTLTAWGVIERARNHRAGHYSRRYRLGPAYQSAPTAWQTFDGPRLADKLAGLQTREAARVASLNPNFGFVRQNLAAVTLPESARQEAAKELATFTDPRKQAAWLLSLHALKEPTAVLHHSENTGRLYHTVANCPKNLRQGLLIGGEPTAEVDISASQFYLLLDLYPKNHVSADHGRFADTVTSGCFYENLFKLLWERGGGAHFGDGSPVPGEIWQCPNGAAFREAFKVHALRKLLYERLYPATAKEGLWPVFVSQFPDLAAEITLRRSSRRAASAFSCEMQRREAALVLGRVIPRIRSDLAGCLPVTIHDGILCQRRYAADVRRIVVEESARMLGISACVKVKASEDGLPLQTNKAA